MTRIEKNLRFYVGTTISNSTYLFWLNGIRQKDPEKYLSSDSDVCIEGFQRSGNSFFILLFRHKNKQLKVAHHTHGAAQVIKAVQFNIPTIVLIRDPGDTLASLLAWDNNLSVGIGLQAWINFYQKLLSYRSGFLTIPFSEVTTNPVNVVKQLNQKFDTNFVLPSFKEEQLEKFKSKVQARNNALSAPLPTQEKEAVKKQYKVEIKNHHLYPKAQLLYQEFMST